jgi:hypothetical protein
LKYKTLKKRRKWRRLISVFGKSRIENAAWLQAYLEKKILVKKGRQRNDKSKRSL